MIYLELFWIFFKIGLFTFGGGYAMLPLIADEVTARGWATTEDIVNFIAVSESTPGPFAVNISTFIGRMTAGIPGAVCATFGVVLPSFIVILLVARFFTKFKESRTVKGIMSGLRPAVIGLIGAALINIGKTVFLPTEGTDLRMLIISACIFVIMCILAFKKKHPILIICLSAVIGIASGYIFSSAPV